MDNGQAGSIVVELIIAIIFDHIISGSLPVGPGRFVQGQRSVFN